MRIKLAAMALLLCGYRRENSVKLLPFELATHHVCPAFY